MFDAEVPKNKITIVVVIQAGTNPCLYNIHAGANTVFISKTTNLFIIRYMKIFRKFGIIFHRKELKNGGFIKADLLI